MNLKLNISDNNQSSQEDIINKDNLINLNELRKKAKNRMILCIIIGVIAILTLNILMNNVLSTILTLLAIAGLGIFAVKPYMEFKTKYKEMFVQSNLEGVFDNLNYQPNIGISRDIIKNTQTMQMGNRYHSNDYIEADYNGVHFIQSDVCIQEETQDSENRSHTETYFRGRWMIFDFNKEFKANVQVVQNGFKHSKRKRFFGKEEEKYKKVEMEDVTFNKEFKIFAQNEHDAFYILTPQMMERIRNIANNIEGYLILCFIDNTLHVGIHTNRDSFEPSMMKEIDPEVEKQKIINDINLITTFVNDLSLDTKLFKA